MLWRDCDNRIGRAQAPEAPLRFDPCRTAFTTHAFIAYNEIGATPIPQATRMLYGDCSFRLMPFRHPRDAMSDRVAGAFDMFADAYAAAEEMRGSGFADETVRITSNPADPDAAPQSSLADEGAAVIRIVEKLLAGLLDDSGSHRPARVRTEDIRRGGVVVSVSVANDDERSIARAILYRRRAVELDPSEGGVPIY